MICIGQVGSAVPSTSLFIQKADAQTKDEVLNIINKEIEDYLEMLGKSKSDTRFLKRLFYRVQRQYLTDYSLNTQIVDLFNGVNQYDCVTGTAIYALILDALKIDYSIKETDHHVYLLVHLVGKDVLYESTDPIYGFINNPIVIGERIRSYRTGITNTATSEAMFGRDNSSITSFQRDRTISIEQLAGLQYYNLATDAFNNGVYSDAIENIELALTLYPNDRFEGFRDILRVNTSQTVSVNTTQE